MTSRGLLRITAPLGAVAIVCAAVVANPAAANLTQSVIKRVVDVMCNSGTPCVTGNNKYGDGVLGESEYQNGVGGVSYNNDGVGGFTHNPSASQKARSGVFGWDLSSDGGIGNLGVGGLSSSGTGVEGASTTGPGVIGASTSGFGVLAESAGSVAVSANSGPGSGIQTIQAIGGTHDDTSGSTIATYDEISQPMFWVDNDGNAHVANHLYTGGRCRHGCDAKRRVETYASRESVPTVEDIGEGRLVGGVAHVQLDPAFANLLDPAAPYVVFVSPEGPSRGLYVTQKSAVGFTVMENPGGYSTVPFGYRIVAKPYGERAARLPSIGPSQMPRPRTARVGTLIAPGHPPAR
jgi:hypothetical protein